MKRRAIFELEFDDNYSDKQMENMLKQLYYVSKVKFIKDVEQNKNVKYFIAYSHSNNFGIGTGMTEVIRPAIKLYDDLLDIRRDIMNRHPSLGNVVIINFQELEVIK